MEDYTIDINNGSRILKIKSGTTLLKALFSNKVFISSACGGKAVCGLCKVQINEGLREVLPQEKPFFTDDDINQGFRLACQTLVTSDMRITVPEKALNKNQYKTKVIGITQLTHDIKGFALSLPPNDTISFKAGQYIQVVTKPYSDISETVTRAYSIASAPSCKDKLELIIRQVPGGICSTYLNQNINIGDELVVNGPYGDFYLHESDRELVLIAGGSGVSPIKSIIMDIFEKNLDRKMTFFFGAVTKKDLYYVDFFESLASQHSNFRYIPTLSKPESGDSWDGETGLVTEVVDRYIKDSAGKGAYLCGSPGMINACINVLKCKGFSDGNIHFDKF